MNKFEEKENFTTQRVWKDSNSKIGLNCHLFNHNTYSVVKTQCLTSITDEDAPFTEGVWSIILCVLAGASYLWWHCSIDSSDTVVDTYTSLTATLTVSSPCYGLCNDCNPSVHTYWDIVFVSHVLYVQFKAFLWASFAKCVQPCKYDDNLWSFIVKPHSNMAMIVNGSWWWFQHLFTIIVCHVCISNGSLLKLIMVKKSCNEIAQL